MYCEFYGFREKPFNITPNPRFIFLSKNHREAFAHLIYGIDSRAGFIELTGEVGTGKTTLLRTLLEELDERGQRTALIFNPCLSALELMRSINREFGLPSEGSSSSELLEPLNRFLLAENSAGRTAVLVIDEAQNLEPQVLEQVRLISNLETKTDKLIQIILAGQPELRKLLARPELRQISQRITVSYHLGPMDSEDTAAYVEHRLEVAGAWRAATFNGAAMKKVFRYSGGTPRLVNIVCDRALLFGYIGESREITGRMVNSATSEIKRENGEGKVFLRRARPFLAGVLALAVLLLLLPGVPQLKKPEPPPAVNARTAPPVHLSQELSAKGESESAISAFNALAELWEVPPLPATASIKQRWELKGAALQRGLNLFRYTGSLGQLVRIGYPALLEFSVPGQAGKRYLALTRIDQERYVVAPPLSGGNSLSSSDLESIWSGNAWIPWKNYLSIPVTSIPGGKGKAAARLQELLRQAGSYRGRTDGVLDRETAAALKTFQAGSGLAADGNPGAQTLLLLYRAVGKYPVPALVKTGGGRP